ncbi:MAG: hypothetical protein Q9197_001483 [Variospora fuerteventurae]
MVHREAHLPPLNTWQGLQDIQSSITDDKSMPKITKRTGRHSMTSELSTTSKFRRKNVNGKKKVYTTRTKARQAFAQSAGHDTNNPAENDPFDEPENKEDIGVTLGDFSARTRSQATAVKRFAKEAGLKVPEEGTAPRAAISSRIFRSKPNLCDLNIEAEEDESFPSVPAQKNPWPNISRESSLQAWQIWDEQQEDLARILESPQYTLGRSLPSYPNILKDLISRLDFDSNDASPRTFEPQIKHWQEFEILLQVLRELGSGRELGYLKMKIPAEAFSKPSMCEDTAKEMKVKSLRVRPDPMQGHHCESIDTTGIYYLRDQGEFPSRPTDHFRAKLNLLDPKLTCLNGNLLATVRPKTYLHLSATAGVTRPLRTSPLGAYSLHYLHRGAPVTWTVIDPCEYRQIAAFVHYANHAFGGEKSAKRPRQPPQCTASANHQDVYVSHGKLTEWDVGWTSFEQFAGDLVVLGPFVWAQYFTNEAGVMEEGVYGDANWKDRIARKGFVKQCSAACGGGNEGFVDFKGL